MMRERKDADAPPATLESIPVCDGVVSLAGYGIRIGVERGHLVLADGIGRQRRAGHFNRATCGIKRLLVRGTAFALTGDALAWLTDIGAAFLALGWDSEVIAVWSPPGANDARIRRGQALAPWIDTGLALTKRLLREKLLGQAYTLERYIPGSAETAARIRDFISIIDAESDAAVIRYAEGQAADGYWQALASVPLTFVRKDLPRVPEHWRTIGPRISPVTHAARGAATPTNALLNYLYTILETEARIACQSAGLDPALGLFHADRDNRDSLALDVMEPVRPQVDAWLLGFLREHVWSASDFGEIRSGVCRLSPHISHMLGETALAWQKLVAPYAREVAQTLLAIKPDMPSSQLWYAPRRRANPSAPGQPIRPASAASAPPARTKAAKPAACRHCGVVLPSTRRKLCDDCLAEHQRENAANPRRGGFANQPDASGLRPSDRPEARAKVKQTQAERRAINAAWEQEHGQRRDDEYFRSEILPKLRDVSAYTIAKVTGYSSTYASGIKNGTYVPHARVWDALANIEERRAEQRARSDGAARRRERIRDRKVEQVEWERAHGGKPDPSIYTQQLAPHLHHLALKDIIATTGMTQTFCSAVKRGEKVPHPMHWEALARLAGIKLSSAVAGS